MQIRGLRQYSFFCQERVPDRAIMEKSKEDRMRNFRRLISCLPRSLRLRILRKGLDLRTDSDLIFKVADSAGELEQIPLTKWNTLPSTNTLVCLSGGKVLASVSLIADTGFGLPSDQKINLGRLRKKGTRILELQGLTGGDHLLPLLKFTFEFSTKIMRADALIILADEHLSDKLSAVLPFEPLEEGKLLRNQAEQTDRYQFLNLHGIEAKLKRDKKLCHYLFEERPESFQLPEPKYHLSLGPVISAEDFRYLFLEKTNILTALSAREQFFLSEYYHFEEFRKILPTAPENVPYQRSSPRIPVRYRASVINTSASRIRTGEVHQIALHGLALNITNIDFNIGEKISIVIDMEDNSRMKIQGNIVWTSDHSAGVKLEGLPTAWREFNEYAWSLLRSDHRLSA